MPNAINSAKSAMVARLKPQSDSLAVLLACSLATLAISEKWFAAIACSVHSNSRICRFKSDIPGSLWYQMHDGRYTMKSRVLTCRAAEQIKYPMIETRDSCHEQEVMSMLGVRSAPRERVAEEVRGSMAICCRADSWLS